MPAQCRDEVGGNRPAKVDRHRSIEPVDMDGAVEAIMETRRDMAAQKALGHFVVVPHACDRAIAQRCLGRELDHRLLDFQAWPPSRTATWSAFLAQSPRPRADRSLQIQQNVRHHALAVHADWRVCQKFTTRSAVEGIRRVKFNRALSMSAGAGIRLGPSRSRIKARTVAHSRPIALPTIRIGSWRSPVIRLSSVAIFTPDIAEIAATDSSYLNALAKPSSAPSFKSPARCKARIARCAGAKSRRLSNRSGMPEISL